MGRDGGYDPLEGKIFDTPGGKNVILGGGVKKILRLSSRGCNSYCRRRWWCFEVFLPTTYHRPRSIHQFDHGDGHDIRGWPKTLSKSLGKPKIKRIWTVSLLALAIRPSRRISLAKTFTPSPMMYFLDWRAMCTVIWSSKNAVSNASTTFWKLFCSSGVELFVDVPGSILKDQQKHRRQHHVHQPQYGQRSPRLLDPWHCIHLTRELGHCFHQLDSRQPYAQGTVIVGLFSFGPWTPLSACLVQDGPRSLDRTIAVVTLSCLTHPCPLKAKIAWKVHNKNQKTSQRERLRSSNSKCIFNRSLKTLILHYLVKNTQKLKHATTWPCFSLHTGFLGKYIPGFSHMPLNRGADKQILGASNSGASHIDLDMWEAGRPHIEAYNLRGHVQSRYAGKGEGVTKCICNSIKREGVYIKIVYRGDIHKNCVQGVKKVPKTAYVLCTCPLRDCPCDLLIDMAKLRRKGNCSLLNSKGRSEWYQQDARDEDILPLGTSCEDGGLNHMGPHALDNQSGAIAEAGKGQDSWATSLARLSWAPGCVGACQGAGESWGTQLETKLPGPGPPWCQ